MEENEVEDFADLIDPDAKPGVFVTLQVQLNPETDQINAGIVKFPLDLRIVEEMQEKLGEEMRKVNMKFHINAQGEAFLMPIKTSTLIGFD